MKRFVTILLAAILLLSVATAAVAENKHVVTLLYPWSGTISTTDDLTDPQSASYDARWGDLLAELDLTLKYVPVDFATADESIRIMMSTGDLPDMSYCCDQMTPRELVGYANQGMLRTFTKEQLAKYPNIQRNLDSITAVDSYLTADGSYCAIPRSMDINGINGDYTYTLIYRKDMALAAGCEIKDAYTPDELYDFYMKVKETYPDFYLAAHPWPEQTYQWGLYQFCPNLNNVPASNFYFNAEKGKYVYAPAEETTLDGIMMMKKFYDSGILVKDYINWASYEANTQFLGGNLFSYWYGTNPSFFSSIVSSFYKNNPEAPADAVDVLILKDAQGKYMNFDNGNKNSEFIFSPYISDEKLDACLKMLDYLMSDEGIERMYYGLEGVNFTRNEDGTLSPLYKEDGVSFKSVSSALICQALVGEMSIAIKSPFVSEYAKERIGYLFDLRAQDDPYIRKFDVALSGYTSPAVEQFTLDASNQIHKMVMTLKAEEIPDAWNAWLKDNASAYQKVEDDLNANVKH